MRFCGDTGETGATFTGDEGQVINPLTLVAAVEVVEWFGWVKRYSELAGDQVELLTALLGDGVDITSAFSLGRSDGFIRRPAPV